MKRLYLSFIIFALLSGIAFAEVIKLKNGETFKGKILERTEDTIKMDPGIGVSVSYYLDEIESIDGLEVIPFTSKEKESFISQEIIRKTKRISSKDRSKWEVTFYQGEKEIARQEADVTWRVCRESGTIPDGVVHTYDDNGKLRWEGHYQGNRLNGISKGFYESGASRLSEEYKDGVENGLRKEFYENGNLKAETHYKNGVLDGSYKHYYESGTVAVEGTSKNHQLVGARNSYGEDGKLKRIEVYEDGRVVSVRDFDKDGQTSSVAEKASSPAANDNVIPLIRLEKSKYVVGENARFWIGAKTKDGRAISWPPHILYITKPNGRVEKRVTGPSPDGMESSSEFWGGSGLGMATEPTEPGTYLLEFEIYGRKTSPMELIIEELDISKAIEASFVFAPSEQYVMDDPIPVTFIVNNKSDEVIRFRALGFLDASVSMNIVFEHDSLADLFYPDDKLIDERFREGDYRRMSDIYNWEAAKFVPTITLQAGETYKKDLMLSDAYDFACPGHYRVTLSTTLSILVGEEGGPYVDVSPLRKLVQKTQEFKITDAAGN